MIHRVQATFKLMYGPTVFANPITVINPGTSTVTDPINKMEVAHTVGHRFLNGHFLS